MTNKKKIEDKKEKLRTKNTPLREDLHLIGKTGKE